MPDQQLLREYSEGTSEDAFAELVRRHVDFVYSIALRMVRDAHLAEDVAQGVFLALARSAPRLLNGSVLAGWLHQTTRNLAANAVRSEARRYAREQEAAVMNQLLSVESETPWEHLAPQLDAALGELRALDRDVLLLRFFQRQSAREMARSLGTSEEAAQKRVHRALERLRECFAKREIAAGTGLAAALAANGVQAAPAGLAAGIASTVLAGTAPHLPAAIAINKIIAMTTMQKALVAAALAVATGTGIYEANQARKLKEQVRTLQEQQAPLMGQIQSLREDRDEATNRLASLANEVARLNGNEAELLRLRGEVSRLRPMQKDMAALQKQAAQANANLAEWKPDQVTRAGRTTPLNALQTYLWSAVTTNVNELTQCLVGDKLDPPAAKEFQEFAAGTANHPTKEWFRFKVLSQNMVSPDETQVEIQAQLGANGNAASVGVTRTLTLRQVNGEWKLVVFNVRDADGKVTQLGFGTLPSSL